MAKIPALHPTAQAWLLDGPLSPYVAAYVSRLKRGRYAASSARRALAAVAHFAHWMSSCSLPAHLLDEGCIDQFLRYHLPRCDCPDPVVRTPRELHGCAGAAAGVAAPPGCHQGAATTDRPDRR